MESGKIIHLLEIYASGKQLFNKYYCNCDNANTRMLPGLSSARFIFDTFDDCDVWILTSVEEYVPLAMGDGIFVGY